MRKLYPFAILIFVSIGLYPQAALFKNNGADIYVKDGGFMIVKTNSLLNEQISGTGTIHNDGTIVVEGNITNDATILGNGDTIELQGDWINNNAYTGNNSWVYFNGGPQVQNIMGSAITTFDNLDLSVGNEKFQRLNAVTAGLLQLNNAELATDVNNMLVTNPNPAAITWGSGYVSSFNGGQLARVTNSTSAYDFPVGSPSYNNGPSIFRPITMTPNAATTNTFGACVTKGDATNDGYNVTTVDNVLCLVNPNFYHHLYNGGATASADVTMYYSPATDGNWTDEGHWKNAAWNYIAPATAASGLGFSTVTVPAVSDFNPNPFALAVKRFNLSAGPNVTINEGQTTTLNPTIGAAAGSLISWTPDQNLSCTACAEPNADPTATTRYTITVTDPAGCKLSDSVLVAVVSPGLLIPTGFSPNGDGVNDVFHVLNKNLAKIDLAVFDRWGNKVYETNDWTVGWDGTYKGMKQEIGVYVWECSYQFLGETTLKTSKGNVTLIR